MENTKIYITSKEDKKQKNVEEVMICNVVLIRFPLGLDLPS